MDKEQTIAELNRILQQTDSEAVAAILTVVVDAIQAGKTRNLAALAKRWESKKQAVLQTIEARTMKGK